LVGIGQGWFRQSGSEV